MWLHYIWYRIKIGCQINTVPTHTCSLDKGVAITRGGGGVLFWTLRHIMLMQDGTPTGLYIPVHLRSVGCTSPGGPGPGWAGAGSFSVDLGERPTPWDGALVGLLGHGLEGRASRDKVIEAPPPALDTQVTGAYKRLKSARQVRRHVGW